MNRSWLVRRLLPVGVAVLPTGIASADDQLSREMRAAGNGFKVWRRSRAPSIGIGGLPVAPHRNRARSGSASAPPSLQTSTCFAIARASSTSMPRFAEPRDGVDDEGFMRYRASKRDCDACALKPRCCPRAPARKILRSIHEGARDRARAIATTGAYVTSRRERKKVEMLFAHLKRILRLDRLRLRGPNGARDEFHLAATAQNLMKLAKLIPMPA